MSTKPNRKPARPRRPRRSNIGGIWIEVVAMDLKQEHWRDLFRVETVGALYRPEVEQLRDYIDRYLAWSKSREEGKR